MAIICKRLPKSHDEVLDVLNNAVLYDSFIYILRITHPKFLNIDKVEQIFILEHFYSLQRLLSFGNSPHEVVWNLCLMVIEIRFQHIAQGVLVPVHHCCLMYIEHTLIKCFRLGKDLNMMRKSQFKKVKQVQIASQWLPIYIKKLGRVDKVLFFRVL